MRGRRSVIRRARAADQLLFTAIRGRGPKVFVVGKNKTGTTTLQRVLKVMGYRLGDQARAEILYHNHYFNGEFEPIIAYCREAEAFQDVPFSSPGTFAVLDEAFPESRFILSVRRSAEEWYESLLRFHGRHFGTDGRPPTADQLKKATYRTEGFMANLMKVYGTTDDDPYDRERLLSAYEAHNAAVRAHFVDRPGQLLEIDVASPTALIHLEEFLGRSSGLDVMPHENRST